MYRGFRQERYSERALSEAYYSGGYLYLLFSLPCVISVRSGIIFYCQKVAKSCDCRELRSHVGYYT
jgi:hypothetical protein